MHLVRNNRKQIYLFRVQTQHLSVAAQSIYFLPANETIAAQLTSTIPRLFVEYA